MTEASPRLALPYLQPAQAQKHVTVNEALARLDLIVQAAVTDRSLTAPPPAPVAGARHIVAAGATGDWAGQDGRIAHYGPGGWEFVLPQPGWLVQLLTEMQGAVFDGTLWRTPDSLPQSFLRLGISTTADVTNRLSVEAPATLLSHAGAGHQVKINKAGPGDTASLLYQTGFSGRAEVGLAGDDDLVVKVSPDGSAWSTALSANRTTGKLAAPSGLDVSTGITGTAVTQTVADTTAGRLVKVRDSTSVLAQIAALSVLGNATNATANIATIAAGSDHQVLRRSGTAVAFGAVALNQATTVTGALGAANGGTGVVNNAAATLTRAGNHALTLTTTATTSVTLPTAGTLATIAGAETLTGKTLTAPVINTSITGTAITQGATDATVGRLLKTGDFGLGLNNVNLTEIADMDAHRINGFFRWTPTTTGRPSDAGAFLHLTRIGNVEHHQIGFGLNDRVTRRRWTGGVWGAWQEIYHAGSVLGTVSQTAGVPTGAVMQHGSSANGFFERRVSGWAVCTRTDQTTPNVSTAYGSLFRSADIAWTFPTAFFAGTLPAVSFSADNADVIGSRVISLSATSVTFQLVANASIAGTTTVRASAVGRWSDMA